MQSRAHFQNNHSLIFQFIVSDYLAIHQLFKFIDDEQLLKDLNHIKKIFITLIDAHNEISNIACTQFNRGLLSKLQNSCQHFASYDQENTKNAKKLESHVQKMSVLCYQAWKIIKEDSSHSIEASESLIICLKKIRKYQEKIGRLIAKLFLQFEDNEAVLLFLLQNYKALDNVYQTPFVSKQFSRMFSKGIGEAEKYITKQYSQRGYHQLLPQILEKAKELQQKKLASKNK